MTTGAEGTAAVIVAAGRGTRMGPGKDKLFLEVAGWPVVGHTWRRFDTVPGIDELVLVVRDGEQGEFEALGQALRVQRPYRLVPGGAQRQDSVWNGLEGVSDGMVWVAVQDGARPCTTAATVAATLTAARRTGAAVAASRVVDTIKESDAGNRIVRTVDRTRLWAVQTPQVFRRDVLRRALATVRERGLQVTDDTAACELIGVAVELVETPDPNPKVTVPTDLEAVGLRLGRLGRGEA